MRNASIMALAAALAVLASCIPTEVCGCTPIEPPTLLVVGSVEDSSGAPLAGAEVTLDVYSPTCGDAWEAGYGAQVTGTDGRSEFRLYEVPPPACILVRAIAPAGAGVGSAEATLQHTAEAPLPFGREPGVPRIEVTLRFAGDSLAATRGEADPPR